MVKLEKQEIFIKMIWLNLLLVTLVSFDHSTEALICPEELKACPHTNGSSVCVDNGLNCDCGSLPPLSFGHYKLVNASNSIFGASAKVVCDSGYTSETLTITCQSSGHWENAVCSKAAPSQTKKKESGVNIIIVVVVIVLLLFLNQLLLMCYLQWKIHIIRKTVAEGNSEVHKTIMITLLGSIPIVGLVPIYLTWKVFYREVYKVILSFSTNYKHKEEIERRNQNGHSNNIYGLTNEHGRGQSAIQNKEDEFSELRDNKQER